MIISFYFSGKIYVLIGLRAYNIIIKVRIIYLRDLKALAMNL